MTKRSILIGLTVILSLLLSYLSMQWLIDYLQSFSIESVASSPISPGQKTRLFIPILIFFLAFITLPFYFRKIVNRLQLQKAAFWKIILGLEALCLISSFLATPPDLWSSILCFLLCQLIVLSNGITYWQQNQATKNHGLN